MHRPVGTCQLSWILRAPRSVAINDIMKREQTLIPVDMDPVSYTHLDVYKRKAPVRMILSATGGKSKGGGDAGTTLSLSA